MGQTSLPHLLDKGIYLEDSNILLDWGSSRGVLLQLGGPQTEELPGGRVGILWRNRRWLSGLASTFYCALRKNELLHTVEIWPTPGRQLDDEFQRHVRHISLHLGAATRASDRPDQLSRFWKRGEIEISLSLKGRAERLDMTIINRATTQPASAGQAGDGLNFERHLEKLGVGAGQWQHLKNYLLDLQSGLRPPPPPGLENHPVVALALQYLQTRDSSKLDRAATLLAGSSNQAWLMLDKS